MMLPSRLGCPMSQKTPNMGNPGYVPSPDITVRKCRSAINGSIKVLKRSVVFAFIKVSISPTHVGKCIRTNCDCFIIILNRPVKLTIP